MPERCGLLLQHERGVRQGRKDRRQVAASFVPFSFRARVIYYYPPLFVPVRFSRYRKYNLFREVGFNRTEPSELCTFDTDFGVRFGMFICFDILFQDPAARLVRETGVKDIIFSTAWFSEIPLLAGKT